MCVPACAHISIFDTLQMAPLFISAKRSMWTDGSVGQWTIPVWSGTETSIQFFFIDLLPPPLRIYEWTFSQSLEETSGFAEGLIHFDSGNGPIRELVVRAVSPHPDPLPQGEGTARTVQ